jgi:hypothetical protein
MGKPTRSLDRKIPQMSFSSSALSYSTAIAAFKGNFQDWKEEIRLFISGRSNSKFARTSRGQEKQGQA